MTDFRPYPKPEKRKKTRRTGLNLSGWRADVMRKWRYRCAACGYVSPRLSGQNLEAHHLVLRSRSADDYVDDPRNGIALCGPWARNCHANLHEGKLKIRPEWLPEDALECLAEQGLHWDETGLPAGPSAKYFAEKEMKL